MDKAVTKRDHRRVRNPIFRLPVLSRRAKAQAMHVSEQEPCSNNGEAL